MKKWTTFVTGLAVGMMLCAAFTAAASAAGDVLAKRTSQQISIDGRQETLSAYEIEGSNYVKLRDIGELLDVNVYWQDGIFIDTASPYTGEAPEEVLQAIRPPMAGLPAEPDVDEIRQEIVRLTNELRAEKGLPALEQDEKLMEAAQVRAEEMAATAVYDHIRPDGSKRSTVTDCPYTTENIHRITAQRMKDAGAELAKLAVDEWTASKVHLEGMLDKERSAIGVGVAKGLNPDTGKECWYCVQWFLRTGYTVTWVDEPILKK